MFQNTLKPVNGFKNTIRKH